MKRIENQKYPAENSKLIWGQTMDWLKLYMICIPQIVQIKKQKIFQKERFESRISRHVSHIINVNDEQITREEESL
jgi:hypothetical protein